jgi:hypothetical protein
MNKNYHHPIFVQYKKSPFNLFLLDRMKKKNYIREKKKKKIGNILKGKRLPS